jgi:GDP-D-mannose dehydratase
MSKGAGKTIFVFGITGQQGGSVATYLLEDGFSLVGLTRNTASARAQGE